MKGAGCVLDWQSGHYEEDVSPTIGWVMGGMENGYAYITLLSLHSTSKINNIKLFRYQIDNNVERIDVVVDYTSIMDCL
jgi:hypothetical protein